ncbi:Uma2 family endonuclease, partial [Phormidium sp. CCY1219]|nr:Uma2 family endonuclease [Phormidium sp. CCY1219]
ILSPGNRLKEMSKKLLFYNRYGVEEYYIYDPQNIEFQGFLRAPEGLQALDEMNGWVSPRLGIRFELKPDTLEIYTPPGDRFLTFVELNQLKEQERQRAEQERQRAEQERQRAEQASQRAEQAEAQLQEEQQRYQALIEQLRARGMD